MSEINFQAGLSKEAVARMARQKEQPVIPAPTKELLDAIVSISNCLVVPQGPKGHCPLVAQPMQQAAPWGGAIATPPERLVIYCLPTGVSAAHATHCATYCTPCRPLVREFPGWIRTPPPTRPRHGTASRWYAVTSGLYKVELNCVGPLFNARCNCQKTKRGKQAGGIGVETPTLDDQPGPFGLPRDTLSTCTPHQSRHLRTES